MFSSVVSADLEPDAELLIKIGRLRFLVQPPSIT